ncbi:MAG: antibiotic biosynthesis monooxygenase [Acidimicrobiia bacterium]|nr:antibiotic biosynthesis monooxygenase [Acidimicrobiia bacterium]
MSEAVSWDLMLAVKDGQLESLRELMDEMVAATTNEPGALVYEWFISGDGTAVHIYERYADSDAVLIHLGSFANFADRFFGAVDPTGFFVYGEPSDTAAEALTGAGAQIMGRFGGFAR